MDLAEQIYRLTRRFPNEEKSGLAAALRRSVTVLPGKIADALEQPSPQTALNTYTLLRGTLRELQTDLLLCARLRLISTWTLNRLRRRCRNIDRLLVDEIEVCEQQIVLETQERQAKQQNDSAETSDARKAA